MRVCFPRSYGLAVGLLFLVVVSGAVKTRTFDRVGRPKLLPRQIDWLVDNVTTHAKLEDLGDAVVSFDNGLVSRLFSTRPNWATFDIVTPKHGSTVRAIGPEAVVTLDGVEYHIGGLIPINASGMPCPLPQGIGPAGNCPTAYLNLSQPYGTNVSAFQFQSYSLSAPTKPFDWSPGERHSRVDTPWPPLGQKLDVKFTPPVSAPASIRGLRVTVSYELFQGIAVMSKSVTVSPPTDPGAQPVMINNITVEYLRVYAPFAPTGAVPQPISGGFMVGPAKHQAVGTGYMVASTEQVHGSVGLWHNDITFDGSYGHDVGALEPSLTVAYAYPGPGQLLSAPQERSQHSIALEADGSFVSFRSFLLLTDSLEHERHGLMIRRMISTLAPQTTESPLYLHTTNTSLAGIQHAVDQMTALGGFDTLVYSFGSGFELENTTKAYIEDIRKKIAYANSKGIAVGGYDLIMEDRGDTGYSVISPVTGKPEDNACFASKWVDILTNDALTFIKETNLSMLITDGPYGGQICAATDHAHHHGEVDSVENQYRHQVAFYRLMRSLGVLVHAPDDYFLSGGPSKCSMGYHEYQFSVPRLEQIELSRSTIYDDTWTMTPTMGWMFAPLSVYHSNGGAAALEPFHEHMHAWNWTLAMYIGYGNGATLRGPELYDTPEVFQMVKYWADFWVQYRRILTGDIIHIRRPSVRDIDAIMHVSSIRLHPLDALQGMLLVYNPTPVDMHVTLPVNMYYTGAVTAVVVAEQARDPIKLFLQRDYTVDVQVNLAPKTMTWFTVVVSEPS